MDKDKSNTVTATVPFPTRDEFRAWLASKGPRAIVGQPCFSESCPLAYYLLDHGAPFASIDPTGHCWTTDRAGWTEDALPAWAEAFGREIDNLPDEFVTASRALGVLDQAVRS